MLLEIRNLSVEYSRRGKVIPAVRNVSLSLNSGETLGIVGESGCGKSTLALSILRLISSSEGKIARGEILFDGKNLLAQSANEMRKLRGKEIAIIFQDPFSSLNPVIRMGEQVEESILIHNPELPVVEARARTLELFRHVRLPEPERIYHSYPHQISGGQRQRVMIAIAIANRPKLLIADEPTTALDVTVQKEILELLATLQKELEMAILLVTHHLGIISHFSHKLVVLYGGEVVEQGKTREVIQNPQHPYTRALLETLPKKVTEDSKTRGPRGRLTVIPGAPPDPARLPSGCIFHPRCNCKVEECVSKVPVLRTLQKPEREVACHLAPF